MNTDCRIIKILPPIDGVTKDERKLPYHFQPIVIGWEEPKVDKRTGETYLMNHSLEVELRGETAKNFTLEEGTNITIDLRFESRVYNGKYFNKIFSHFIFVR